MHLVSDMPEAWIRQMLAQVRRGEIVDDSCFDQLYPEWARKLSQTHWTPVTVGRRAAALLTCNRRHSKILDVGSGVGKFCLMGALATSADFVGVEMRPHFVALSRNVASAWGIERVKFIEGQFTHVDWREFNGVYLFNPFYENISENGPIDSTVAVDPRFYRRYVSEAEGKLSTLKEGARVVTYWGFGGRFPSSYRCMLREFCFRGFLECWEKCA